MRGLFWPLLNLQLGSSLVLGALVFGIKRLLPEFTFLKYLSYFWLTQALLLAAVGASIAFHIEEIAGPGWAIGLPFSLGLLQPAFMAAAALSLRRVPAGRTVAGLAAVSLAAGWGLAIALNLVPMEMATRLLAARSTLTGLAVLWFAWEFRRVTESASRPGRQFAAVLCGLYACHHFLAVLGTVHRGPYWEGPQGVPATLAGGLFTVTIAGVLVWTLTREAVISLRRSHEYERRFRVLMDETRMAGMIL